jgi:hypothetical protein
MSIPSPSRLLLFPYFPFEIILLTLWVGQTRPPPSPFIPFFIYMNRTDRLCVRPRRKNKAQTKKKKTKNYIFGVRIFFYRRSDRGRLCGQSSSFFFLSFFPVFVVHLSLVGCVCSFAGYREPLEINKRTRERDKSIGYFIVERRTNTTRRAGLRRAADEFAAGHSHSTDTERLSEKLHKWGVH